MQRRGVGTGVGVGVGVGGVGWSSTFKISNDLSMSLPPRQRSRGHRGGGVWRWRWWWVVRYSYHFLFLFLCFLAFIIVEYYKLQLGMLHPPQRTTNAMTKSINSNSARRHHAVVVNNDSSLPTTTTTVVGQGQNQGQGQGGGNPNPAGTYGPTTTKQARRINNAKARYAKSYQYWRTHSPDPIPPLDNDNDDNGKHSLPPVIAYATTLTSCSTKRGGILDGAAVLLHSIRRNSYGWVPIPMATTATTTTNDHHNHSGAAVRTNNYPKLGGGMGGGRYRYRAYVFVDPSASPNNPDSSGDCARYLRKLGYILLHRAPLVPLFEITDYDDSTDNTFYTQWRQLGAVGSHRPTIGPTARKMEEQHPDAVRMKMANDGCCGYTELLKLHVYGLVEHELAVHLDFDSLLLRPMDDLFDVMLGKGGVVDGSVGDDDGEGTKKNKNPPPPPPPAQLPLAHLPRTKVVNYTRQIDAAFTRDYNSVNQPGEEAPVGYQGGFLVVRPNMTVLERFRTILQRGEFILGHNQHERPMRRRGWGGTHGGFYGDVTFQGILPYYYEAVAPVGEHNEAELDRCIYNQMGDNPRKSTYRFPRATPLDPEKMGFRDTPICRDGRANCTDTDCQRTPPETTITTHFTFCKKPWDCSDGNPGTVVYDTCSKLLEEWYRVRRELEDWRMVPSEVDTSVSFYWRNETLAKVYDSRLGTLEKSKYHGYCNTLGTEGYRTLVETDVPRSGKEMQMLLGPAADVITPHHRRRIRH